MRRFVVPGGISLVVVALLAVLAYGLSNRGPSNGLAAQVSRGARPAAPNATMRLQLLGSSARESLASLRGKVVLVNVFAGWCPPCTTEAPILRNAQRLLARNDGTVVGVTFQDSSTDARSYMQKNGLAFPVLLDPGDTFTRSWGVNAPPETFILNREGKVVAARPYEVTAKWVSQALTKVLRESA
ncbi:MAG: TlpA family protein disulfide reductase [Acidobacteriota bacterium]|nr:TlpA family protein disulfide reductase [Acidobacteriota bacterium]